MHQIKKLTETLGSTSAFNVDQYLIETPDYGVAVTVDNVVGVTWNRSDERPQGFPSSYKHQQWFILPEPLANLVLAGASLLKESE